MAINRSNIPLPEEVYNPQAGGQAFGNTFAQSLFAEINAAKAAKLKRQEQAYGVLKEMASSKYYEPIAPIDWNAALQNPEAEMGKFKRISPVEEQLIDLPVYQQGATGGVEQVKDPQTGLPMTYKGKQGQKPEIISRPSQGAQADLGEQDFYKMSPQEQQAAIRIAKGDDDISKYSTRGKLKDKLQFGAQQWAEANGIPYNNYIAQTRQSVHKDFTVGNAGKNVRSLNTAIGHLASLTSAFKELGNTGSPLLNKPWNVVKKQLMGNPAVTKVDASINAVAGELATVFKNTSGTDQEIEAWKLTFSRDMAPVQSKAFIDKGIELLGSRLDVLRAQWDQAYQGTPKTFDPLNPKSKKILSNLGHGEMIGGTQQAAGVVPTGQPRSFNSVEEAEAANLPVGTEITIGGRRARVK